MSFCSRYFPGVWVSDGFQYNRLTGGDSSDDSCESLSVKVDLTVRQQFFLAAYKGDDSLARSLCKRGHSPNFQAENLLDFPPVFSEAGLSQEMKMGMSPLHLAVLLDRRVMIKFLVENQKVDVDPQNSQGATPLFLATIRGCLPVVRYLIRKGAAVNHRDRLGRTPWYLASRFCCVGFDAKPALADTPEGRKVQKIRYDMMRMLAFFGADTGARLGRDQQTVLEIIVNGGGDDPTLLKMTLCRNMLLMSAAYERKFLNTIGYLFPMKEKGKTKMPAQTHEIIQLIFEYYFDDLMLSLYKREQEEDSCIVFSACRLETLMQPDKIGFLINRTNK